MQLTSFSILGALLVTSLGCAQIVDDNNKRGDSAPVGTPGAPGPAPQPTGTPSSDESRPSSSMPAGEPASSHLPFLAESKSSIEVINVTSPGRLEVNDGCLTVAVKGKERATAVFPPGVKPELRGNDLVAVSFEGRRIPVGEDTLIPGGGVRLSSADLVKPIPSYCPKLLFGLGG